MASLRPLVFWLWVVAVYLAIMYAIYHWGHPGSAVPDKVPGSD
jgi:hypothetical protein